MLRFFTSLYFAKNACQTGRLQTWGQRRGGGQVPGAAVDMLVTPVDRRGGGWGRGLKVHLKGPRGASVPEDGGDLGVLRSEGFRDVHGPCR